MRYDAASSEDCVVVKIRSRRWVIVVLAVLVAAGCGARTELVPPRTDARAGSGGTSADAGVSDARPDAPVDVTVEAAADAGVAQGCADGQREGFVDAELYPSIAGCSGGFSLGGVLPFDPGVAPACPSIATRDTLRPACGRRAGDDGPNPRGIGCNVSDLCAVGWHVCASAADVDAHSPTGCRGATAAADPSLFFVTRQSSNGCGVCATGTASSAQCDSVSCASGCAASADTSNDVFGCGNFGSTTPLVGCSPLDRFSYDLCSGLPGSGWSCDDDGTGRCEAYTVVHAEAAFGGALCCAD